MAFKELARVDVDELRTLHKKIDEQNQSLGKVSKNIEKGVAKECARMILPLNTQTTIYMTGTLRSWLHYLDLRCAQSTQKEHRDIAVEIKNTLKDIFPQTFSALDQQVSH